jgi:hypothetical protein
MAVTIMSPPLSSLAVSSTYARRVLRSYCACTSRKAFAAPHMEQPRPRGHPTEAGILWRLEQRC